LLYRYRAQAIISDVEYCGTVIVNIDNFTVTGTSLKSQHAGKPVMMGYFHVYFSVMQVANDKLFHKEREGETKINKIATNKGRQAEEDEDNFVLTADAINNGNRQQTGRKGRKKEMQCMRREKRGRRQIDKRDMKI